MDRANTNFLKVDIATALTFSGIALQADDPIKKNRNRRNARKGYDTIVRLVDKVHLSKDDAQVIREGLRRLKSELERLGEVF